MAILLSEDKTIVPCMEINVRAGDRFTYPAGKVRVISRDPDLDHKKDDRTGAAGEPGCRLQVQGNLELSHLVAV